MRDETRALLLLLNIAADVGLSDDQFREFRTLMHKWKSEETWTEMVLLFTTVRSRGRWKLRDINVATRLVCRA